MINKVFFYIKKTDFEESLVIDQDFTIVIYNFKAVVEKSLNLNKKRWFLGQIWLWVTVFRFSKS